MCCLFFFFFSLLKSEFFFVDKAHTYEGRNAYTWRLLVGFYLCLCLVCLRALKNESSNNNKFVNGKCCHRFTHLQPAQPVRFSHWLMSHVAALQRDCQVRGNYFCGKHEVQNSAPGVAFVCVCRLLFFGFVSCFFFFRVRSMYWCIVD